MGNKNSAKKAVKVEHVETREEVEDAEEMKQLLSIPIEFFDLPDEIFSEIIQTANLGPLGLQLRLDKRTELRIHSLLKTIRLEIHPIAYYLTLNSLAIRFNKFELEEVFHLSQALNRWSATTNLRKIEIIEYSRHDENIAAAMLFLCQFNTDQLVLNNENEDAILTYCNKEWDQKFKKFIPVPAVFSELDFTTLLVMAANIREVTIDFACSSLEAMDLCIFRKSLIDDDCKLESFSILVKNGVEREFLKAAFKVTIEDNPSYYNTVTYRSALSMRPVKMYTRSSGPNEKASLNQIVFDGNLKTEICDLRISFKRITEAAKHELMKELREIEMDHVYER